ncbi:cytochrome P450 [Pendulispora albinea]|uniref:Cytochrome P450 n=1 Tax=Pendulispora albinea TaxID=2741071 RepID=A0ABZ2M8X3_9BACT
MTASKSATGTGRIETDSVAARAGRDGAAGRATAHEPLSFLDRVFPSAGEAIWLPGQKLCIANADAARAILANAEGAYEEHSDFFRTRRGTFGPRAAQVAIGGSARALLTAHRTAHAGRLGDAVRMLAPVSEWPDAGNRLVYAHLAEALLSPARSGSRSRWSSRGRSNAPARSSSPPSPLRRTLDDVVARAVLAGARERQSRLGRAVLRFRVAMELGRALEESRKGTGEPADLLDVVARGAPPDAAISDLVEVYLSFVFAIAGSVGFTLGWSVYLLGTHPDVRAEPAWIVREALRLWPVAWMLARRPARTHDVLGVRVTPKDYVVVCPYLVHRNPKYWDEPRRFRPQRWASPETKRAFMPFGFGPHACAAGSLSMQLVEDILRILAGDYALTAETIDPRPHIGPALAPPRFALHLRRRSGPR